MHIAVARTMTAGDSISRLFMLPNIQACPKQKGESFLADRSSGSRYDRLRKSTTSLRGVLMLDRWRLAILFAAFGFVGSGALIASGAMGSSSDLEVRWGWVVDLAFPAHLLIRQFYAGVNYGTSMMLLLMVAQTVVNAAIWFGVGAVVTRIFGGRRMNPRSSKGDRWAPRAN
jgi:hypothetical protein